MGAFEPGRLQLTNVSGATEDCSSRKILNLYRSSGASCSLRTSYSRIFSMPVRNLVGVKS